MLPANQKKVLELIMHPTTLSCLKPSRSSGLLSMSCPFCLLGALQIKPSLVSNTCDQSLAFCAKGTRVTLLMPSFSILTLSCLVGGQNGQEMASPSLVRRKRHPCHLHAYQLLLTAVFLFQLPEPAQTFVFKAVPCK